MDYLPKFLVYAVGLWIISSLFSYSENGKWQLERWLGGQEY